MPAVCVYKHTGYDITNYFRSEVILKKTSKMPPPTASGEISRKCSAVENVDTDVCVNFGGSSSNGSRNIRRADFVSNVRI